MDFSPFVEAGGALAFTIVAETSVDVPAREALLDRAMGPKRRKKSSEKLRRGRRPSEGLAFVARDAAGTVVGTVRLWDVVLGESGGAALLLGPLAVCPSQKSAGIGSALMRHAIGEARRLGHRAILLVGDASYYGRFGFSAEKPIRAASPSGARTFARGVEGRLRNAEGGWAQAQPGSDATRGVAHRRRPDRAAACGFR
jgi:predicted N-acetyltransferase YhbS